VEAAAWFRKAADQGYAEAQTKLGDCYVKGDGVKQDSAEAVKWYRMAAEQNHPIAQLNLADCYFKGKGVEKNHVERVKWLTKAARHNIPEAQLALGLCYFSDNLGVEQNVAEGYAWLSLSARTLKIATEALNTCLSAIEPQEIADGEKRMDELLKVIANENSMTGDGLVPRNIPPATPEPRPAAGPTPALAPKKHSNIEGSDDAVHHKDLQREVYDLLGTPPKKK
jgi:hypothetical protein